MVSEGGERLGTPYGIEDDYLYVTVRLDGAYVRQVIIMVIAKCIVIGDSISKYRQGMQLKWNELLD